MDHTGISSLHHYLNVGKLIQQSLLLAKIVFLVWSSEISSLKFVLKFTPVKFTSLCIHTSLSHPILLYCLRQIVNIVTPSKTKDSDSHL